jgi:hypothetical protein
VGIPARIVLFVGFAVVLALAWPVAWDGGVAGPPVHLASRGDGVLEGRVELAEDFALLRRRACVPALVAQVELPFGPATAEVEENGRFYLSGLPIAALDLELRLGGELLALVEDITPRVPCAELEADVLADPRLAAIALAGPLRWIDLSVVGLDGVGLDHGCLAWRASGDERYERVVPVRAGRASIATSAEAVDVLVMIAGCEPVELVCAVGGERLAVPPVGPIVAYAPDVPEGLVLRLELAEAAPSSHVVGAALLPWSDVHGGWAATDGRAELYVVGNGPTVVQWGVYRRSGGRRTRERLRGVPVLVGAGGYGERRVVVPLDPIERSQRRARGSSR